MCSLFIFSLFYSLRIYHLWNVRKLIQIDARITSDRVDRFDDGSFDVHVEDFVLDVFLLFFIDLLKKFKCFVRWWWTWSGVVGDKIRLRIWTWITNRNRTSGLLKIILTYNIWSIMNRMIFINVLNINFSHNCRITSLWRRRYVNGIMLMTEHVGWCKGFKFSRRKFVGIFVLWINAEDGERFGCSLISGRECLCFFNHLHISQMPRILDII